MEVEVLRSYDGQEEDELTIHVGDIISDVVKSGGGWWEGRLNGRKGVFPDTFVRERNQAENNDNHLIKNASNPISQPSAQQNNQGCKINPSPVHLSKSKVPSRRFRAVFSYDPVNPDELKLSVNDVLEVLAEEEEGWWRGLLNGKIGVFPSNFVEPLESGSEIKQEEELKDAETMEKKLKAKVINRPSIPSVHPTVANKPQLQLTKSSDSPEFKNKSIESTKATESSARVPALPPKIRDNKPTSVERVRAVFSYVSENDDELTLNVGDVITVLQKKLEDAGWWRGELKGKIGVFPDNFVEPLPSDDKPVYKGTECARLELSGSVERKEKLSPLHNLSKVHTTVKPVNVDEKKVNPQIPTKSPILQTKKPADIKLNKELKSPVDLKSSTPVAELKFDVNSKPSNHVKLNMPNAEVKPVPNSKPVPEKKPLPITSSQKTKETADKEADEISSLDVVNTSQKLVHLTANRVRPPSRRPPTAVSIFQAVKQPDTKTEKDANVPNSVIQPPSVAILPKDGNSTKPIQMSSTTDNKNDFVADYSKSELAVIKVVGSSSSSDISSVKRDPINRLQTEVAQLKQELDQLKFDHKLKLQDIHREIDKEKKAQRVLLEEVGLLKNMIQDRFGKL